MQIIINGTRTAGVMQDVFLSIELLGTEEVCVGINTEWIVISKKELLKALKTLK